VSCNDLAKENNHIAHLIYHQVLIYGTSCLYRPRRKMLRSADHADPLRVGIKAVEFGDAVML
jgi:hypothetical protein